MILLIQILMFVGLCAPLYLFFDYNKRSNIHYAIVYVVVFAVACIFVIRPLVLRFHIYLAMAVPLLMVIFLFIAKKRKGPGSKRKTNDRVIDDF